MNRGYNCHGQWFGSDDNGAEVHTAPYSAHFMLLHAGLFRTRVWVHVGDWLTVRMKLDLATSFSGYIEKASIIG